MKPNAIPELFDPALLQVDLNDKTQAILQFKKVIKSAEQTLFDLFDENQDVATLLTARSRFVDRVICRLWRHYFPEQQAALLAVGGYGREELHPHSDIDILLLFKPFEIEVNQDKIESFLTFLWDIGLEIGSSVRTIKECVNEAGKDITIATNIVESRRICGDDAIYNQFLHATSPDLIWPSNEFFTAKIEEQKRRYLRFHDTAYNLEPNIKESPGGLRDIHMIGWITKRHFGDKSLADLVKRGFLTNREYQTLYEGQCFLWKIRFGLHQLAGRREDRLSFDYQRQLADKFGYQNETAQSPNYTQENFARSSDGHRLAVEIFMKDYYRTIRRLSLLNDMLLQHYQETILFDSSKNDVAPLNNRFHAINDYIEARHDKTFVNYPFALLEIFLLLQQNPQLKGIRGSTIRLIRENLHLIDGEFRQDIRCKSLFMEILRQPEGITHALRQMNRFGILPRYLPEFGKIVGQMQFDLFHIYTVDEHTLFVVRNIRRFAVPEYRHEFPLCSQLIQTIPKPELLYIAGIYHDIAKGRGGDHSILGEEDARQFCQRHGLSYYDTELVAWLVRNHLLMSTTAQHKDITDPDVINEFALKMENKIKLDYLYLLTVADIRATNNSLWNSWKDSLLKKLRQETRHALRRGLSNPLLKEDLVAQTRTTALEKIGQAGLDESRVHALWQQFGDDYFLRYSPEEITHHAQALLEHPDQRTLIDIDPRSPNGGTNIFLKTPIVKDLFAKTTSALDAMNLNIVEARIVSSLNQESLNTYTVLDADGNPVTDLFQIQEIQHNILKAVANGKASGKTSQTINRRIACFIQPTEVNWEQDKNNQRTLLEIISIDRPGLLSLMAFLFLKHNISVSSAKITTLGAHVDDVFYITDMETQGPVDEATMQALKTDIIDRLDCK